MNTRTAFDKANPDPMPPALVLTVPTVATRQIDVDDAREIHQLAFPEDDWAGDDHTYWASRRTVNGALLGFCSAHMTDPHTCFLSRAAVVKAAQGQGLHKRMIAHRVYWAWQQGALRVITYTTLQNYASMTNLLDVGFRFYKPHTPWVGKRVHYFQLLHHSCT